MADIRFPGLDQLKTTLLALHLLSEDKLDAEESLKLKDDKETPASVQVIRSGSLAFAKDAKTFAKWATSAGVVSGAAGVVAWAKHAAPLTQAAFVLGGAGIIIAALFVIAIAVHSDVHARAFATASRYQARAAVAAGFIAAVEELSAAARPAGKTAQDGKTGRTDSHEVAALLMETLGAGNEVKVNLVGDEGDNAYLVQGVSDHIGEEAQLALVGGKTAALSKIRGFKATFPPK